MIRKLFLIDSHTGGEPTRTILDLAPPDPNGDLMPLGIVGITAQERMAWLRQHGDWIRQATVLEPRGNESMVGALVGPPRDGSVLASVVFFNNAGYLGMCGHGLIGVVETLRYQGIITPGRFRFDTPVGDVDVTLEADGSVSFDNVTSFRYSRAVTVNVPVQWPWGDTASSDTAAVTGDVVYSGNWFYIVSVPRLDVARIPQWMAICQQIREALHRDGITGADSAEIDHIELSSATNPSRNFVLCPGGHYDRSPCGTGTCAKVACLAAEGTLAPGETWIQESIIGSRFVATYRSVDGGVCVTVTGRAHVMSETVCVITDDDPFRLGIQHA